MSQLHTHYANLFVTRNAPLEVIRAAYKALAQKYHPDRNRSQDAERVMKLINKAWHVLSDSKLRQEHDEYIQRNSTGDSGEAPTTNRANEHSQATAASPPKSAPRREKSPYEEIEAMAAQLWFKNHTRDYVVNFLRERGLSVNDALEITNKLFH